MAGHIRPDDRGSRSCSGLFERNGATGYRDRRRRPSGRDDPASAASSNRTKPPDFVFSQWQRALRLEDHRGPQQKPELAIVDAAEAASGEEPTETRATKPPIDRDAARNVIRALLASAEPGRFLCVAKQWCAAKAAQGWRIVTVDDARFIGIACDEADIVVTPAMLRFRTCRSGALLFSGQSLRRTGAVEILAPVRERRTRQMAGRRCGWCLRKRNCNVPGRSTGRMTGAAASLMRANRWNESSEISQDCYS
jgi:hypothetical protein